MSNPNEEIREEEGALRHRLIFDPKTCEIIQEKIYT